MSLAVINCILFLADIRFLTLTPVPGDSVPFALKVSCPVLKPDDNSYKFCAWIYDPSANHYISQIWTQNAWKPGWTAYQPFYSDSGSVRNNWFFMRIYKDCIPESCYISFKYKDTTTENGQIKLYYPDFKILNADSFGYLQGVLYQNSLYTIAYPNIVIIAKDTSNSPIGCYVSENNNINEGNISEPGWFSIAVPIGTINNLEFENLTGDKITAYVKASPPYEIFSHDTTYIEKIPLNETSDKPVLTIAPQSFSPGSNTNISYTLPLTQASVKLYIYDRKGRLVKKLLDNSPSNAQSRYSWEHGIPWDGKSDTGNPVSTGLYIVYLEAKDQASTKTVSTKSTVAVIRK